MYFSPYLCERAPDINSSRAEMHAAFSIYGCKPEILSLMQHLSNSCEVISPELFISKQYHNISSISKALSVELAVAAWKPIAAHLRGVRLHISESYDYTNGSWQIGLADVHQAFTLRLVPNAH